MKNGFTLIEVMIVTAIIGILASIALPSYTQYVERSRRVAAQGQLMDEAHQLERHFVANGSYTSAQLMNATSPTGGRAAYTLALTVTDASTFKIEATPVNAQSGDSCGTLSIDQSGNRQPADCWD